MDYQRLWIGHTLLWSVHFEGIPQQRVKQVKVAITSSHIIISTLLHGYKLLRAGRVYKALSGHSQSQHFSTTLDFNSLNLTISSNSKMMETILEVPEMSIKESQKIIQQQLVLILHAHGCQRQEGSYDHDFETQPKTPKEKCKLPYCESTKQILDHIRCCFEPETCQVSSCSSNREIIRHWKTCMKKSSCPLCRPVYQAQIHGIKSLRSR